jgi:hypothetical protein
MREDFENYFVQALHNAKIQELVESYTKKGFLVRDPPNQGDPAFDLLVENPRDGHVTAFEVKVMPLGEASLAQIDRLLEAAKGMNYDFRLVTIARPTRHSIAIDWIEEALFNYLIDNPLSELDELSTHTKYDDVTAEIRSLSIKGAKATVTLDGTIDLVLQYGSASDRSKGDGFVHSEPIPFSGQVELDLPSRTVETADLRVDLSAYHGQ